ncbi:Acetyl-CoA:oxalate CoA-transferase [Cyphellophora attinorum]|uniref:Acetyl-CoA:oxalate CoA-transferase n=1 Tax=Cyphellophora attinorum TaxID=1664694 RepID=A0A0N1H1T2_9EURO|nr:Acetyl-CoA:oxalate CoA-transferase [Phialophora attinorum]KPI38406.1 Acetyl-CoA:oxalate CoA-transferase [Phialophora attinorum]
MHVNTLVKGYPLLRSTHEAAYQTLEDILQEFDVSKQEGAASSNVRFEGDIPHPNTTHSQNLNLTLVGCIPALANAVAAAEILEARGGPRQTITADLRRGHNYIDPGIGMTPTINGQEITMDVVAGNPFINNIFETRDGKYAVLSAVYVDLAYKWTALLGCSMAEHDVREKVKQWFSTDLEDLALSAGMPMAICQTESSWTAHPQGQVLSKLPWVPSRRLPTGGNAPFSPWSALPTEPRRPLSGIKVLCLTHAIAGPSAGRTLAEHGASVLQIMFTHGFEHQFVYTYANLGTASTRLNLNNNSDRARLRTLVQEAHVWIDSFRPGAIAKFGFDDVDIFALNPAMIVSHIRVYGTTGPWAHTPGFDMQGSASSGMMALCGEGVGDGRPQWPPGMVINDYTTGYSTALAIQSMLLKRFRGEVSVEDGWLLSPSLCGTAMGILKYFKTSRFATAHDACDETSAPLPPLTIEEQTGLGYLRTLAPLPQMGVTPICYENGLLVPMGSSSPVFPGFDQEYSFDTAGPDDHTGLHAVLVSANDKIERLRVMGEERRASRDKAERSTGTARHWDAYAGMDS